MLKNKIIPFALLALSQSILAQQIPGAGSQMQQIPPAPLPQKIAPNVDFKPIAVPAPSETDNVKIVVRSLKITGSQAYSEDALLAVSMFKPGSELSLSDLRAVAAKIAAFYHQNGYFLAQAYLPAQDIKNGEVTIAIIEGRYGKITLNNQTNLSNDLAGNLLDGLNKGDLVANAPLENRLLLLSDIPGVTVKSTLVPGTELGTSDLIVDVTPGRKVTGSIDADNAGNRYTGENRIGATINLNNPTGHGDVATLRALTSGPGLSYARASYQMQFGKATAGVAYSYLDYTLGREFESLQAHGTAKTASIFGSYPLIRSRNNNLYAGLNYDAKTFQDKVDSTGAVTDKQADVLAASLYGDHRDNFGVTAYSLTGTTGNIDLQTPSQKNFDAATAQSNGRFNKLGFTATRLQNVTETISFYTSINGQAASKNLDMSEKMRLGGMYGVRAYPEGEAYGDEGYVLNLEVRMQLPKFSEQMPGQLQLIAFVDSGTVTINKNPWAAGPNRRTLSGAGVGINWSATNNFILKAYYARKLGSEAATSAPDASGRFWIQGVKYF
ncbi:MAG: ShlB/FhaC/HecB family hemolysin secretion/activation protein [Burkholderiaceae bacterium]